MSAVNDRSPVASSAIADAASAETMPPAAPFVVGIGASAGGLEALEKLFEQMPAESGMVFVVIQHLSPDFKSLTDTLLARRTVIPIRQAENGMPIEPNTCYLLPPRKDMILSEGRLLLTDKEPAPTVALPIDRFFRSMAQDVAERAVAVVLSGTGSDGSRGIREIRAAGGLVIAQSPETAKFDGMPNSALATGVVEYALAPEEIPAALLRHAEHPDARDPAPGAGDGALPVGMQAILQLLRDGCGIDFSAYKPETVTRRIGRRVSMMRLTNLDEYAERVASERSELDALYKDLLIGVTRFFRDAEAFEVLKREVLPKLLASVGRDGEFRVWVAGCATGEEAYSLGMVINECLDALPRPVPLKLFATDVHRASLDIAGAAFYPPEALAGLNAARRERFFVPKSGGYQIAPELRKQIVFAQHNLLKDAPFTKVDLITCRNLLIYFLPAAQKKVLSLFHFGLQTGGALFLGPSEGTGDLSAEFDVLNPRWKIYRKRRDVRLPTDIPLGPAQPSAQPLFARADARAVATTDASPTALLEMLLDECLAPGVLVDSARRVVRTMGGASRFLAPGDGWFSSDILEIVRSELRPVLAGALPRAMLEGTSVTFRGLSVRFDDGERVVDVRVKPIRPGRSSEQFALVSFDEAPGLAPRTASRVMDVDEAARAHMLDLEAEIRSTKESLQATIEELETSNEELQATNEELVASNEELQSTNEELHSVNEELYTVNGEFQRKIDELTELTADVESLLASTEVHTVFLDQNLCIRKFTPKIAEAFNLLPQDVGRRFDHFTHSIDHPRLADDLAEVLATGRSIEWPVRDRRGRWHLLRILPYQAAGARVGGVVLTLVDIDRLKRAEAEAILKDQQLAGILRNSPNWVFVKDLSGKYVLANEAFRRQVGRDPLGLCVSDLFSPDVAAVLARQDDEVRRTENTVETEVVIPQADGPHTYLSIMFPIRDETGRMAALGGVRTDVTALKRAESDAREAVAQRDRFLAMLSHELRNPLSAIINCTRLIRRTQPGFDKAAEWFPVIERRARHMTRLLDDLLDVARVTQAKLVIRRQNVDLAATVPGVLEEVAPVFADRRIELAVDPPPGPLTVVGDPGRLHQVQVNLLMNAAKYTRGGGSVGYRLRTEDGHAVVRVRDDGAGMSPDILRRAFDPFVQADATLDRADGGIGVGLTLVRSIVELHGGAVQALSDGPDKGSEFIVRLPLAPAPPPEIPSENGRADLPPPPPRAESTRPLNVLIVEDDPDNRSSLGALLSLDGHVVASAGTAAEALDAVGKAVPDVAVLDIGLPEMSGYELARILRERFGSGRLPLVALTGYGQPADRARARNAGFDHHLTKPVDVRELTALLSSIESAAVRPLHRRDREQSPDGHPPAAIGAVGVACEVAPACGASSLPPEPCGATDS